MCVCVRECVQEGLRCRDGNSKFALDVNAYYPDRFVTGDTV